jgi:hypothetical protein
MTFQARKPGSARASSCLAEEETNVVQAVFCAHSTGEQVEAAVSNLKSAGIHPTALTIVSRPQELEWIACPQTKLNLSLKRGIIGGAVVGALLGIVLLLYMPSAHNPWGEASLVAWEAFGWALFGMIVGSSGLLAESPLPESLVHHFEEAIGEGKILVSLQVASRAELDRAAATLYKIGAADIHETQVLVA